MRIWSLGLGVGIGQIFFTGLVILTRVVCYVKISLAKRIGDHLSDYPTLS